MFVRVVRHRPGEALRALYWRLLRKRVRARNILLRASSELPFAYEVWIARIENSREAAAQAPAVIDGWKYKPRFGILLHGAPDDETAVERSLRSLEGQIYSGWALIGHPSEPIGARLARADADYILPLRAGHRLATTALYRLGQALQAARPSIIYGDEDRLDEKGERYSPWFKPRWNREYYIAQDLLSSSTAIATSVARHVDGQQAIANIADLTVGSALQTSDEDILHIPHVLSHTILPDPGHEEERRTALAAALMGQRGSVSPGPFGTTRVTWPLPSPAPMVSLIIPTKDKVELLQPCIETVLARTDYQNFEILIVDNRSVEPATAAFLSKISKDSRIRVLDYAAPYNFSAINNFAVSVANGQYVCLLNNDTEVIEPAWLSEMMRYAIRPDIGAVGAKLLYDDGTIQHAGVTIGIGDAAGHAHRFEPNDKPGYFALPHSAHFVSAVTAACLTVDKRKYEAVGGLDEDQFTVAFNDVDFCLRLQTAGWKNVYVPHAVLLHHESKSRGSDMAPSQIDRYRRELSTLQERWDTRNCQDPLHNPNLDRYSEKYVIRL